MTTTKASRLVDTELDRLNAAIADEQGWRDALDTATTELRRLETLTPGSPDEAAALAGQLVAAREQVELLTRGTQRAQETQESARRAVVAAEAETLQPEIDAASKAVAAHQGRTRELLAALADHTGTAPTRWQIADWGAAGNPAEHKLSTDADRLRCRQQALRMAAEGGDPTTVLPLADLPDTLRVGGVLPCRAALDQVQRDAEAEAERVQQQADQDQITRAWAALNPARHAALEAVGATSRYGDEPPEPALPYERAGDQWMEEFTRDLDRRDLLTPDQRDALLVLARLTWPELAHTIAGELTRRPERDRLPVFG